MKIPNDTGHPYRLNKFVEYQHHVPPIHPITLLAYAKRFRLAKDDILTLAWLQSATYCEVTALFLYEALDWKTASRSAIDRFWKANKSKLIFNSARRYAKNMDWFPEIVHTAFGRGFYSYDWAKSVASADDGVENYFRLEKQIREIPFTGRFAGDLVLEMMLWATRKKLWKLRIEEPNIHDWKNMSNLTSGLLNVYYQDDAADEFDKLGKINLPVHEGVEAFLGACLKQVQKAVEARYPKQESSLPLIQTKLCSFRNLFKGTRYGGYHHDRQLENIRTYQKNYPDFPLWYVLYQIRAQEFPKRLLGEIGGWNGIRKERNKLWLTKGLTGVE